MLSHLPYQRFTDLSRWRDAVNQYFVPLDIRPMASSRFENLAASDTLGPIKVTELKTAAQRVVRTSALARQAEQLMYKATLQLHGHSEVQQDQQRATLGPGQWCLYDTTRPYEVAVDHDSHFIVLQLPSTALTAWAPCLQSSVGRAFSARHGSARIAMGSLQLALRERQHLSNDMCRNVADSILRMMGLGIAEHLETDPQAALPTQDVRLAQLQRIQDYIQSNLHNPDLSVTQLAAHFRISKRYLYKLFAMQAQTPADYIQEARLERCKHLLSQPGRGRQIGEIAYQHGYVDAAVFSHAFKRRYGLSPSEWRQRFQG